MDGSLFMGFHVGKYTTWNAKCPIFLGNITPKTSNYCLKNRAFLGFPGIHGCYGAKFQDHFQPTLLTAIGTEVVSWPVVSKSSNAAGAWPSGWWKQMSTSSRWHRKVMLPWWLFGGGDSPTWVPPKIYMFRGFFMVNILAFWWPKPLLFHGFGGSW